MKEELRIGDFRIKTRYSGLRGKTLYYAEVRAKGFLPFTRCWSPIYMVGKATEQEALDAIEGCIPAWPWLFKKNPHPKIIRS